MKNEDKMNLLRKTDTTLVYIASKTFTSEIIGEDNFSDLYIHVGRDKGSVIAYRDNDRSKVVHLSIEDMQYILKCAEEVSNLEKNLSIIIDKFNNGKCIVFCGAGISRESGILTVEPLLKKIFEYLNADQEDVDAYLFDKNGRFNLPIPFEAIVQSLKSNIKFANDSTSFIEVFAHLFDGKPNLNHFLLANLLKENKINCIITTNFDTCIEQALGWTEGDARIIIPYKETLESLEKIDLSGKIVKLHGCKTLPDLLGTTVSQITRPEYLQKTNLILEKFLCTDLFDTILFLGYSCSDKWDISEFFNNCRMKNLQMKQCIYWQHTNNPVEQKIEPNVKEMLKKYNSVFMFGDTRQLVESLWNHFGYIQSSNPSNPEKSICNFVLNEYLTEEPEFVLNKLFQDSELHNIAKKYCLRAIENYNNKLAVNKQEYIYKFINSIMSFGDYYAAIYDTKNAENFYGAAMQLAIDNIKQDKNLAILFLDLIVKLANILMDNGKTDEAEKNYLIAIDFYEQDKMFDPLLASVYNDIALLYEQTAPRKVSAYYKKALEIYEKEAKIDPVEYGSSLALTLNNLGMFYWKNNAQTEAAPLIEHSLNIYRNLARANGIFKSDIGEISLNLGLVYKDLGKINESKNAYKEAIGIQKDLAMIFPEKHSPKLAITLFCLGNLYLDNDLSKAQEIQEEALEIRRKLAKNKSALALKDLVNSLTNLGNVCYRMKKYDQARVYSKEALQICRQLVKVSEKQYLVEFTKSLILYCSISEKISSNDVTNKWYSKLFEVTDKLLVEKKRYLDIQAIVNFNFANYKYNCRIYSKAIKHYKVSLEIYDKLFKKDPDNYYIKILEFYHRLISQLSEKELNIFLVNAFETLSKSLTIFLNKDPNNLPIKYFIDYSSIAIKLGIIYFENNDYLKSKNIYSKTLRIINTSHSVCDYEYQINLGLLYCELANTLLRIQEMNSNPNQKAMLRKIESIYLKSYIALSNVTEQFCEGDRLNFSIVLSNIEKFYEQIGDLDNTITYMKLSVQSYEALNKISSNIEYMQRLSIAKYYLSMAFINKADNDSIKKAETCLLDMLEINTKISEIDASYTFWLGGAQITIAEFYKNQLKNREKSLVLAQKAYYIFKEYEYDDQYEYDMQRVKSVIEFWNKN